MHEDVSCDQNYHDIRDQHPEKNISATLYVVLSGSDLPDFDLTSEVTIRPMTFKLGNRWLRLVTTYTTFFFREALAQLGAEREGVAPPLVPSKDAKCPVPASVNESRPGPPAALSAGNECLHARPTRPGRDIRSASYVRAGRDVEPSRVTCASAHRSASSRQMQEPSPL